MAAGKKKNTTNGSNTTGNASSAALPTLGSMVRNIMQNLQSEQTRKIIGLGSCFLALCLLVSFLSYAWSWGADSSYIKDTNFKNILLDSDIETDNLLGRLGSYLSHLFIYRWFGLASFAFVYVFLWLGRKWYFNLQHLSIWAFIKPIIFYVFLSATLLGYIFGKTDLSFPFGGGIGTYVSHWLNSFMGLIGTGILLFFIFLVSLIVSFNIDVQQIGHLPTFFVRLLTGLQHFFNGNANTNDDTATASLGNKKSNKRNTKTTANSGVNGTDDALAGSGDDDDEELMLSKGRQIQLDFTKNPLSKERPTGLKPSTQPTAGTDGGLSFSVNIPVEKAPILPLEPERDTDELPPFEMSEMGNMGESSGLKEYDPTADLSNYQFPKTDLLDMYGRDMHSKDQVAIDMEELERNKDQIIETLNNYGIEISRISATPGPTVTLYEIVPAPGIRISRIRNLEDDIALSLSALGIRIIAPMPGKGTVGIEVPNHNKEIVSLRSLLSSEKFQKAKMDLPVALGKTIADEDYVADLAKMPHLLLAGATGQGKSVALNAILVSLLYKKHPSELKIVMIDPKKVELSLFSIIEKHFLAKLPDEQEPIVTDTKKVINTLNALCIEMDQRYDLLKRAYVRNIREYNIKFRQRKLNPEKGHRYLPYIILVIDEFADLIMTAGKEVEMPLARLAQLARAIGIHLVIATQRPTVNIITGTIKANFPVRIAFKVTSKIDSRTILDQGGANQLIGRGDMLLSIGGDLIRLQCAFIDTHEVEHVADFIGNQMGYPTAFLLPEYRDDEDSALLTGSDSMDWDDLFEEAARIIVQHQQGSTSLIQRRLKLGYNRAGRIMDQLEAAGIVGPNMGSKARDVLVLDEYELDRFFERLKIKR